MAHACPSLSFTSFTEVTCVVILSMAVSLPVHKLHEGRDWDYSAVALSTPWCGPDTWGVPAVLFMVLHTLLGEGAWHSREHRECMTAVSNIHVCTHTHTYIHKDLEVSLWGLKFRVLNNWSEPSSAYTGRTDAEAEAPIFWPPDSKSQLIRKDSDVGKD